MIGPERAERFAKVAAEILGYSMIIAGMSMALTFEADTLVLGGICTSLGVVVVVAKRIAGALEAVYLQQLRDRRVRPGTIQKRDEATS